MKYKLNENMPAKIIFINETETALNATLRVNDKYETIIEVFDIPENLFDFHAQHTFERIVAQGKENSCFTIINALREKTTSFSGKSNYNMALRSSIVIAGDSSVSSNECFRYFDIKVTDGVELIGLCPYDFNEKWTDFHLNFYELTIPIDIRKIVANTKLGKWTFYVIPDSQFDKESLTLKFSPRIHFESELPLPLEKLHSTLRKFTSFLEILCGELVTINELTINSGENNKNYRSHDYVGFSNFPLDKLKLLNGNGNDSTGYLRKAIFKLSDFEDISSSLNRWFDLFDSILMAHGAYQRILLDEDVGLLTENKFLSAMQLVEGYASVDLDVANSREEFEIRKKKILNNVTEGKEFLEKCCTFSGITFLKQLKAFTYESFCVLTGQSKSKFFEKHDKLIGAIKNDRDVYTHSSQSVSPQLDILQLYDMASIFKDFYRINVLSRLGIKPELICKRLFFSRKFHASMEKHFGVTLQNPEIVSSEFDSKMWLFSQQ